VIKEEYFLLTSEGDNDQEYESSQMSGLIVSKAGIFSSSSYREVTEYNSFWAAGSGIEYGLGALEVAYSSEQSPKAIAEIAVRAACKFDSSSGLPLESYELTLEQ
jgi:ATP-dependent protease HslVU (ClpYQ) peptidase subunit